jgi:hypothetical protein
MIIVSEIQQERAAVRQDAACRPHYAPDTEGGHRFSRSSPHGIPSDDGKRASGDSYSGLFLGTLSTAKVPTTF